MGFIVDFGDTSNYTPKSGGKTDLVPKEGLYRAKIASIEEGKSSSGNMTLRFNMLLQDADAKGLRVSKTIPVTGSDSKGKPNINQLLPAFESALSNTVSQTDLASAVQTATNGRKGSSDELIAEFLGKDVFLDIVVKPLTGDDGRTNWVSDVRYFISRYKLESAEKREAHRRALPPQAVAYMRGEASGAAAAGGGATDETVV